MIWPFENDTGAVEKKLAGRSLTANKRRNCFTGMIILAASFLLSFTTILLYNAVKNTKILHQVDNSGEMLITIASITVVLLCTAGLAIKNILYISVLQHTHEFAQLRTLGATYRQIVSVMNQERKKLARKFVLLGSFLGLLCNFILPLHFYSLPSIACALCSGIFIWFIVYCSFRTPVKLAASVAPISALKYTGYLPRNGIKRNATMTSHNLGIRYFKSNPKKAIYALTSLILSGVLMFSIFTVIAAVNIEKLAQQPYHENSDVYLKLNSGAEENSTYDLMKNSPFTTSLLQKISSIYGVRNIYALKMLDCEIILQDTQSNISLSIENILHMENFQDQIVEGTMPTERLTDAIPVIVNKGSIYYERNGLSLQISDFVPAIIDTGYAKQNVTFIVCGFIEDKDTGVVLYTQSEYLDDIAEMNCDLAWYICTEEFLAQSIAPEIEALVQQDNRVRISILEHDIASLKIYFHNARAIIRVVTILISLFSFLNLLNTCITNAIIRGHDYALLEAIGMTKAQILKMQNTENLIYSLGSLIGSCMVGIPIGHLICIKLAQMSGISYITYRFPLGYVNAYAIFIVIIHIIIAAYQKQGLSRHTLVERTKTID